MNWGRFEMLTCHDRCICQWRHHHNCSRRNTHPSTSGLAGTWIPCSNTYLTGNKYNSIVTRVSWGYYNTKYDNTFYLNDNDNLIFSNTLKPITMIDVVWQLHCNSILQYRHISPAFYSMEHIFSAHFTMWCTYNIWQAYVVLTVYSGRVTTSSYTALNTRCNIVALRGLATVGVIWVSHHNTRAWNIVILGASVFEKIYIIIWYY